MKKENISNTAKIVFFDTEVGVKDERIHDIGAVRYDGATFHSNSLRDFFDFISDAEFICGHNIVDFDLKYIKKHIDATPIDTLYLSALLFPEKRRHNLIKDEKKTPDEPNNPLSDSENARKLFLKELDAITALPQKVKEIYCRLLYDRDGYKGFFEYAGIKPCAVSDLVDYIKTAFDGRICSNADIAALVEESPVELAYALAMIGTDAFCSAVPLYLPHKIPQTENVIRRLRGTPCKDGCGYCRNMFDINRKLKEIFGKPSFRSYDGKPLQEDAVRAAVGGKSLLAVFPTAGGKSIAFQLPALMAWRATRGLTVVISPLQSLMKDQVDNLANEYGITEAVTINGLLSPVERADAYERVSNGTAALLYISPEQLRSPRIERLLISRDIARFVIDEAHCFSAWGHDFRVDYLYIGDFIRRLPELKKAKGGTIPVSCFTATAKQNVIDDISKYFKDKIDLDLEKFTTLSERKNLHYSVLDLTREDENEKGKDGKYHALLELLKRKNCPAIVFVSRTKRTKEIAERLTGDGIPATYFNGKMDKDEKIANQDAFIRGDVDVIVATSAFGMGVDKNDVGLVVHYDISDSIENYIQEAGRAGRNSSIDAECCILFDENDLDDHFALLNKTKLGKSDIRHVWGAIKDMTKGHASVCCSALEIARKAGLDDTSNDIETQITTAIAALEDAGYIKRGHNVPHVYASSILVNNMTEASARIDASPLFGEKKRESAKKIIGSLLSKRSIYAEDGGDDAESRVDYLADTLQLETKEVVEIINLMRQEGLLADTKDMSAYIMSSDSPNRSARILDRFAELEKFILSKLGEGEISMRLNCLKELNDAALSAGIGNSSVKDIRTILYFLTIKKYIRKDESDEDISSLKASPEFDLRQAENRSQRRIDICRHILDELYAKASEDDAKPSDSGAVPVVFSLVEMYNSYMSVPRMTIPDQAPATQSDVEDALLYLSKIGAMRLDGGFLVFYNSMEIHRLVSGGRRQYRDEDYSRLDKFYKQKIRQIHIVGEYAKIMLRDRKAGAGFVRDYFGMDFNRFISKYFKGERAKEIGRTITPEKYEKICGGLSEKQSEIINDASSKYIVVAAGPGSGKTRVLVHKLASLLLLEDVKPSQLLMLTFSRAAATEFKKRLSDLIGGYANFVEIKTFHSYSFDLLGKIGNIEESETVVHSAAQMIANGDVEESRITKQVLVIDEAQDMDEDEFELIRALMLRNSDMRVIAVGDDDQNIYDFRGSDSKYLRALCDEYGAKKYEMTENFRSRANIVAFANAFARSIKDRMKSEPLEVVDKRPGTVIIIRHGEGDLREAVADHVSKTYVGCKACVLTSTNEEALGVFRSLQKRGLRAKLIQSADRYNDDVRLYNLAEVRYLIRETDRELGEAKDNEISSEIWQRVKKRVLKKYSGSASSEILRNLLRDFDAVYPKKYRSDLVEFIEESRCEDFCDETAQIYVSTIHKSKGREFDAVYMLLDNLTVAALTEEEKRRLYVGMTRAASELYIHCRGDLFSQITSPGAEFIDDETVYPEDNEIVIRLSHRDVFLSFFKYKSGFVRRLRSGDKLKIEDPFLTACIGGRDIRVVKFSKSFKNTLEELNSAGYKPYRAEVRYSVLWKGQDDDDETTILLPDLYLKKD